MLTSLSIGWVVIGGKLVGDRRLLIFMCELFNDILKIIYIR